MRKPVKFATIYVCQRIIFLSTVFASIASSSGKKTGNGMTEQRKQWRHNA